ncbi:MAG: helix-turn-helix transcriptional regulator [Ruminococcus sp.]|nr:helix-turn-helix transcriptional regulator [Ruminococcus sp.]
MNKIDVKCILSQRLNELIEKKKDSDYTLGETKQAQKMNIPYQTFHKYVTGVAECPIGNLVKIAKYYNVSTDYLLGLSESALVNNKERAACEVTGLNEEAIGVLKNIRCFEFSHNDFNMSFSASKTISSIIANENFYSMLKNCCLARVYSSLLIHKTNHHKELSELTEASDQIVLSTFKAVRLFEGILESLKDPDYNKYNSMLADRLNKSAEEVCNQIADMYMNKEAHDNAEHNPTEE